MIKMETETRCLGKLEHLREFNPEEEQDGINVYKILDVYVPPINDKEPETKEEFYEKRIQTFDKVLEERCVLIHTLTYGVTNESDVDGDNDKNNKNDGDGEPMADVKKKNKSNNEKEKQNKEDIDNEIKSEGTKESRNEGTKENGSETTKGKSNGKEENMNGDEREVKAQMDVDNHEKHEKQDTDKDENDVKEKIETVKEKQDKADKVDNCEELENQAMEEIKKKKTTKRKSAKEMTPPSFSFCLSPDTNKTKDVFNWKNEDGKKYDEDDSVRKRLNFDEVKVRYAVEPQPLPSAKLHTMPSEQMKPMFYCQKKPLKDKKTTARKKTASPSIDGENVEKEVEKNVVELANEAAIKSVEELFARQESLTKTVVDESLSEMNKEAKKKMREEPKVNNKIKLEEGSIKATRQKVNDILGIPMGNTKLQDLDKRPDNDPFIAEWEAQYNNLRKPTPRAIASQMSGTTKADFMFKINFLILFGSTMGTLENGGRVPKKPSIRSWNTLMMRKRITMETSKGCLGNLDHHEDFDPDEDQNGIDLDKGLDVYIEPLSERKPVTKEDKQDEFWNKEYDLIESECEELEYQATQDIKKKNTTKRKSPEDITPPIFSLGLILEESEPTENEKEKQVEKRAKGLTY
nr:hypothetical protein [Tanacetum cinerariifolium]